MLKMNEENSPQKAQKTQRMRPILFCVFCALCGEFSPPTCLSLRARRGRRIRLIRLAKFLVDSVPVVSDVSADGRARFDESQVVALRAREKELSLGNGGDFRLPYAAIQIELFAVPADDYPGLLIGQINAG